MMLYCPVCLTYTQQVEAVTQVNGTQYCAAHGVEALAMMGPRGGGPRSQRGFTQATPPPTPPTPAPAPES